MPAHPVETILTRVTQAFQGIAGVDAVVLGGSHVTGTATEHSDIDIAIYYDNGTFDVDSVKHNASHIDDEGRTGVITDLGEWGPWINGGGWLKIDGIAVDILLRSTSKVSRVIDDCLAGKITIDYQSGHPFGFVNSIYMGEVAACKILWSANDHIDNEKSQLEPFPETYRQAAIQKFLWECEFSELTGRRVARKKDTVYAAGALFRCAISLTQVLYAINGMVMLNEKGAMGRLLNDRNAWLPDHFTSDIEAAISGLTPETINASFDRIQTQHRQVKAHLDNL